jgi:hypothetical protein
MGKVIVRLKIANEADLILKRHGTLDREPRKAEVDAVVDPRVVSFRLQQRVAKAIGVGVFHPARLEAMGRSSLANVTIVPDDQPNVLDRLALLGMDLVIDAKNGRLLPNPEHGCRWMTDEFAVGESRRDSIRQPRVARNELPWVTAHKITLQPQRGCIVQSLPPRKRDTTPSGLLAVSGWTQGSSRTRNLGLKDGIPLGFNEGESSFTPRHASRSSSVIRHS